MMQNFAIRRLSGDDSESLSRMLLIQPAEYIRYFIPFHFDVGTISFLLNSAKADVYMGIFWEQCLIGFFMLRGWDQGYQIPAYGVVIDYEYQRQGLGRLSLESSKVIARLRGVQQLMLKVHPENKAAKTLYEAAGFVQTGIDTHNSNLIYHCDL